jgi:hypothetical protein
MPDHLAAYQANMNARKCAENLLSMVPEILEFEEPISMARFWETVATAAAEQIGMVLCDDSPGGDKAMSEEAAMRFESTYVPPGKKYAGSLVLDVDPKFWLYITEDEFYQKVRRYVKSARFLRRQDLHAAGG